MKKFLPRTANNPKGFTLIELLIVVAVIAILTVIGFAAYGQLGLQAKTRNAVRKADLDAISKALETRYDSTSATTPYPALLDNMFSNDKVPALGPNGDFYCANSVASTQPGDPTNLLKWTDCTAGATGPGIAGYGQAGLTNPPTGTKWKVCTYLEAEINPVKVAQIFCKLSAQN